MPHCKQKDASEAAHHLQGKAGMTRAGCRVGFILHVLSFALLVPASFAVPAGIAESLARADSSGEEKAAAKRLGDDYLVQEAPKNLAKGSREDVDAFLEDRGLKEVVEGFVDRQMALTASEVGEERAEANLQIQRLWWLAAPRLIEYIGDENDTINEAAMKNLILMRSEQIVKDIVEKVRTTENQRVRKWGIFTLGMMREKRETLVPGRPLLSDDESAALVESRINPLLEELKRTDDPDLEQSIAEARQFLAAPKDRRPHQVRRLPEE